MNPHQFLDKDKRLSESIDYPRPEKTITELLTKKDIEEQLNGFEMIPNDNLCYVNLNSQIKYITYDKKTKKELFRFGGLLAKVDKDYIVLSGKNGMRFSVQRYIKDDNGKILYTTKFFRIKKEDDTIKKKYENVIAKTHSAIIEQNKLLEERESIIKKQQKEISEIKKLLKKDKKIIK